MLFYAVELDDERIEKDGFINLDAIMVSILY